jgi:hypothetical protein
MDTGTPYVSKYVKIRLKNSLNGHRSSIFLKICKKSANKLNEWTQKLHISQNMSKSAEELTE